ncbi:MAG: hypothetical protein IJT57_02335, partial [Selenomonadaceae bacterium]|nr:hypothetical protein [Selenomonadaceae bacterium]
MKKTFAVLMIAAMILSAGCGNTMDGAKKDAQDAAAKVEQKADEAKDAANKAADDASKKADEMKSDANAKVDEAKDAANKAADDASKKVDEMKSDANAKMDAMKSEAETMATDMTSMLNEQVIAINGIKPGASVEELKSVFGEATSVDGNTMTFADGLKVVLDGANKVKSISTTT